MSASTLRVDEPSTPNRRLVIVRGPQLDGVDQSGSTGPPGQRRRGRVPGAHQFGHGSARLLLASFAGVEDLAGVDQVLGYFSESVP